jgi:biopolymer transport protein TolR
MAMNGGGRRGAAISTINVTPMADVIIVLLIICMVTVPRLTRQVDLPDATQARERSGGPIVVTLRSDGSITLSEHGVIAPFELSARIREQLAISDAVVQLSADEALSYDRVAEVLAACREAGAEEVAIMTEERPPGS